MNKIIDTLKNKENAILESPTGKISISYFKLFFFILKI